MSISVILTSVNYSGKTGEIIFYPSTGGTYSGGDITFTNNSGGTFNVSGLSSTDTYVTGFTYSYMKMVNLLENSVIQFLGDVDLKIQQLESLP